jgi:hypothetical protein
MQVGAPDTCDVHVCEGKADLLCQGDWMIIKVIISMSGTPMVTIIVVVGVTY